MGTIKLLDHLTLDGVMQGPSGPEEDTRDGFQHGGWAQERNDHVMGEFLGRGMASEGGLLLGRRTFEGFAGYWPKQPDNPITDTLNRKEKYVVSRTLDDTPAWQNSTLLKGEAAHTVKALKDTIDHDLVVLGSGALSHTLLRERLVDELVLMIHPVVLGAGRRLFADGGPASAFALVETVTTTTGVIIAVYR
jgi:dihydrofolate reductase